MPKFADVHDGISDPCMYVESRPLPLREQYPDIRVSLNRTEPHQAEVPGSSVCCEHTSTNEILIRQALA
jgi:hypothetical protein